MAGENSHVDTFGWDVAFAVHIDALNKAVADRKAYPQAMDFVPGPGDGEAFLTRLAADFGPWSIRPGGSGAILWMSLPLSNVRGTYLAGDRELEFRCPDFTGVVGIRLAFLTEELPGEPTSEAEEDDQRPVGRRRLQVHGAGGTPEEPVATLHPIDWHTVTIDPPPPREARDLKYEIEGALADWCNDHLGEFEHVFALIDVFDRADVDGWSFLKPRELSYAYADTADGGGLLACLGMTCTSARTAPTQQQVSSFAIPEDCQAGLLLSPRRLFEDMILPGLPKAWPNAAASDFEVQEDGLGIRMTAAEIRLPDVHHDGAHTAHLKRMDMRLEEDTLVVEGVTEVEVSPGVVATCTSTHWYRIQGVEGKNGKTLNWVEARKPECPYEVHHTKGLDIGADVLLIAGSVIGILAVILTGGIVLIVGLLVAALLATMYIALKVIDLVHGEDAPSLDDLARNATSWLAWTDTSDFRPALARLRGCLQLGGDVGASPALA